MIRPFIALINADEMKVLLNGNPMSSNDGDKEEMHLVCYARDEFMTSRYCPISRDFRGKIGYTYIYITSSRSRINSHLQNI